MNNRSAYIMTSVSEHRLSFTKLFDKNKNIENVLSYNGKLSQKVGAGFQFGDDEEWQWLKLGFGIRTNSNSSIGTSFTLNRPKSNGANFLRSEILILKAKKPAIKPGIIPNRT